VLLDGVVHSRSISHVKHGRRVAGRVCTVTRIGLAAPFLRAAKFSARHLSVRKPAPRVR
jgi:hypothetical protein